MNYPPLLRPVTSVAPESVSVALLSRGNWRSVLCGLLLCLPGLSTAPAVGAGELVGRAAEFAGAGGTAVLSMRGEEWQRREREEPKGSEAGSEQGAGGEPVRLPELGVVGKVPEADAGLLPGLVGELSDRVSERVWAAGRGLLTPQSLLTAASATQEGELDQTLGQLGKQTLRGLEDELLNAVLNRGIDELKRGVEGDFLRNVELRYQTPLHGRRGLFSADAVFSFLDRGPHTVFGQAGGLFGGENGGFNVGLGYRRLLTNQQALLGTNIFVDYDTSSELQRMSVGLEARSRALDLYLNWYHMLGGANRVGSELYEYTPDGFDVELAGRLPMLPWVEFSGRYYRWFLDGYDLEAEGASSLSGLSYKLTLQPMPIFGLEVNLEDPETGDTEWGLSANLKYRFGVPMSEQFRYERVKAHEPSYRRYERVRREYRMRVRSMRPTAPPGERVLGFVNPGGYAISLVQDSQARRIVLRAAGDVAAGVSFKFRIAGSGAVPAVSDTDYVLGLGPDQGWPAGGLSGAGTASDPLVVEYTSPSSGLSRGDEIYLTIEPPSPLPDPLPTESKEFEITLSSRVQPDESATVQLSYESMPRLAGFENAQVNFQEPASGEEREMQVPLMLEGISYPLDLEVSVSPTEPGSVSCQENAPGGTDFRYYGSTAAAAEASYCTEGAFSYIYRVENAQDAYLRFLLRGDDEYEGLRGVDLRLTPVTMEGAPPLQLTRTVTRLNFYDAEAQLPVLSLVLNPVAGTTDCPPAGERETSLTEGEAVTLRVCADKAVRGEIEFTLEVVQAGSTANANAGDLAGESPLTVRLSDGQQVVDHVLESRADDGADMPRREVLRLGIPMSADPALYGVTPAAGEAEVELRIVDSTPAMVDFSFAGGTTEGTITEGETVSVTLTGGPLDSDTDMVRVALAAGSSGGCLSQLTVSQGGQSIDQQQGEDYWQLALSTETADFSLQVNEDADRLDETCILMLPGGQETGYQANQDTMLTLTVRDNDRPVARFGSASGTVMESTTENYDVSLELAFPAAANLQDPMTVPLNLTVGGTAMNDDYSLTLVAPDGSATAIDPTSVVPNGALTLALEIPGSSPDRTITWTLRTAPVNDENAEEDETVVLTLRASEEYQLGRPSEHSLTIQDDEPTISFTTSESVVREPESEVRVGLTLQFPADVTLSDRTIQVGLTRTGDAVLGEMGDYTFGGTQAANATFEMVNSNEFISISISSSDTLGSDGTITRDLVVIPVADQDDEREEEVIFTLNPGTDYRLLNNPERHTLKIQDDLLQISFASAASNVLESAEEGKVSVSLQFPAGTSFTAAMSPISVRLGVTGIGSAIYGATAPGDYTLAAGTTGDELTATTGTNTWTINIPVQDPAPPNNTLTRELLFKPVDDVLVEGDKVVILSLERNTDMDNYLVGTPRNHTVRIVDDEKPTISLSGADSSTETSVSEGVAETGLPEVTINVDFGKALTFGTGESIGMQFDLTGTGTNSDDYAFSLQGGETAGSLQVINRNRLSVTLLIPEGRVTAFDRTLIFTPANDEETEPNETVILTLNEGSGYERGAPSQHTLTINDDDKPEVSFAAAAGNVLESATEGTVPVTLQFPAGTSFSTARDIPVEFSVGGSATYGAAPGDYTLSADGLTAAMGDNTWRINIPRGTNLPSDNRLSRELRITLVDDDHAEEDETVVLTLRASEEYQLGRPSEHSLTIQDDEPTISFTTLESAVREPESEVRVGLTLQFPADVTLSDRTIQVGLTRTGNAVLGEMGDYTFGGTQAANATFEMMDSNEFISISISSSDTLGSDGTITRDLLVIPVADQEDEREEEVILTLNPGTDYRLLNDPERHTLKIQDDLLQISFGRAVYRVSESSSEGRWGISLQFPAGTSFTAAMSPISVRLGVTGSAIYGATAPGDYTLAAGTTGDEVTATTGTNTWTINIPVQDPAPPNNRLIRTMLIKPVNDALLEGDEIATLSLEPTDNYLVGTRRTLKVIIVDDEKPTISLSGAGSSTETSVSEGVAETGLPEVTINVDFGKELTFGTGESIGMQFDLTGTGTNSDDYAFSLQGGETAGSLQVINRNRLSVTLLIPEGVVTAFDRTLIFTPANDEEIEPDETVILTLNEGEGSGYELGAPSQHTLTINDDDKLEVSFAAAAGNVLESATEGTVPVTLQFPAGTSFTTARDIPVEFSVGGSATYGAAPGDYTLSADGLTAAMGDNTWRINIPRGTNLPSDNRLSRELRITLVDDEDIEVDETVILTLTPPAAATYLVREPSVHTLSIVDDAAPTVSLVGAGPGNQETSVSESVAEADRPEVTLNINFPADITFSEAQLITMQFSLEGTATYLVDYVLSLESQGSEEEITPAENRLDLTLQIPAGTYTVGTPLRRMLILAPTGDTTPEENETVILTLNEGSGGYELGTPSQHTLTIIDDDRPTVNLFGDNPDNPEQTIVSETADPASLDDPDHPRINIELTFPEDITFSDALVFRIPMRFVGPKEGPKDQGGGYLLSRLFRPGDTFRQPGNVRIEGGVYTYVFQYWWAIPAGTSYTGGTPIRRWFFIDPHDDPREDDPNEAATLRMTLLPSTSRTLPYIVGSRTSNTLTITDADITPTVSLVGADPGNQETSVSESVAEADRPEVTLNINFPAGTTLSEARPITMQFALEGTATYPVDYVFSLESQGAGEVLQITPSANRLDLTLQVPAGTYTVGTPLSRGLILAPTGDMTPEENETVILTLNEGSGYELGTPSQHTLTITDADRPQPRFEATSTLVVVENTGLNVLNNDGGLSPVADATVGLVLPQGSTWPAQAGTVRITPECTSPTPDAAQALNVTQEVGGTSETVPFTENNYWDVAFPAAAAATGFKVSLPDRQSGGQGGVANAPATCELKITAVTVQVDSQDITISTGGSPPSRPLWLIDDESNFPQNRFQLAEEGGLIYLEADRETWFSYDNLDSSRSYVSTTFASRVGTITEDPLSITVLPGDEEILIRVGRESPRGATIRIPAGELLGRRFGPGAGRIRLNNLCGGNDAIISPGEVIALISLGSSTPLPRSVRCPPVAASPVVAFTSDPGSLGPHGGIIQISVTNPSGMTVSRVPLRLAIGRGTALGPDGRLTPVRFTLHRGEEQLTIGDPITISPSYSFWASNLREVTAADGSLLSVPVGVTEITVTATAATRASYFILLPSEDYQVAEYPRSPGGPGLFVLPSLTGSTTPTVSLGADPGNQETSVSESVAEADRPEVTLNINFSADITLSEAQPITMQFALGGTATYPDDYAFSLQGGETAGSLQVNENRLDLTLQVPAGTYTVGTPLSRGLILAPTGDMTPEENETVILTLNEGSGYELGTPSQHTLTIIDDDRPLPSFEATSTLVVVENTGLNVLNNDGGLSPVADATVELVLPQGSTWPAQAGIVRITPECTSPTPDAAQALNVTQEVGGTSETVPFTENNYWDVAFPAAAAATGFKVSLPDRQSGGQGGVANAPATCELKITAVTVQVDSQDMTIPTGGSPPSRPLWLIDDETNFPQSRFQLGEEGGLIYLEANQETWFSYDNLDSSRSYVSTSFTSRVGTITEDPFSITVLPGDEEILIENEGGNHAEATIRIPAGELLGRRFGPGAGRIRLNNLCGGNDAIISPGEVIALISLGSSTPLPRSVRCPPVAASPVVAFTSDPGSLGPSGGIIQISVTNSPGMAVSSVPLRLAIGSDDNNPIKFTLQIGEEQLRIGDSFLTAVRNNWAFYQNEVTAGDGSVLNVPVGVTEITVSATAATDPRLLILLPSEDYQVAEEYPSSPGGPGLFRLPSLTSPPST